MEHFSDLDETTLGMMGGRLQRLFDEQVGKRADLETRWIEDLRQYNGQYDPDTQAALESTNRSKAFINITRPKCNKQEARIGDVLFPTDDRNWGISPTPVPDLVSQQMDKTPMQVDGKPLTINGKPVTPAQAVADIVKQAQKKAEAMQREMDDQLRECNYNGVGREVIHSAVVLGTGVMKGPVIIGKTKKKWSEVKDEYGDSVQVLSIEDEHRPIAEAVDVWNFYPDMNARTIEEAEFVFERHYMNRRQLRDLKKRPGFIKDQITELLKSTERQASSNNFMAQLKSLSGTQQGVTNRYEVLEYHGPISAKELSECGCDVGEDADETDDLEAIVWFCEGRVIKAALNPLDTEERPYSVYPYEKDDTSIFGLGVPRLTRHQQNVINGAWRMAMDNAGLATGPQIIINERVLRPADNNWALTPRKIWILNDPTVPINQAFGSFEINAHTQELLAIVNQAKMMIDEESGVPPQGSGDQGSAPRTNMGIAMTMNSHNIDVRRCAKLWDDCITKSIITRFYDWNMQYNDNEEIKGDYRIDARGSSVLLAKEMQQGQLMQFMQMSLNPVLGPSTKVVPLQRKIAQAMQLEADEVVKTDDEIEAEKEQAKGQPPQMPPEIQVQMQKMQMEQQEAQARIQLEGQKMQAEMMKIQAQMKNDQMDAETSRAQIQRDFARFQFEVQKQERQDQMEMAKMANERDMTIQSLQADLGMKKLDLDSKHQLFNAEAHIKATQGSGI